MWHNSILATQNSCVHVYQVMLLCQHSILENLKTAKIGTLINQAGWLKFLSLTDLPSEQNSSDIADDSNNIFLNEKSIFG